MINLTGDHLSPSLAANVLPVPNRDDDTATMLENRDAIRSAVNIQGCILPSKETITRIFGDVK
tara:strand:- start:219 stop:407 length:189 start_codon:yes stop_codon:yes gene_type:complete